MAGVGKLTYLEFLQLHINDLALPEKPINITILHLHDFDGNSIEHVKHYILARKGLHYIPGQHVDEALACHLSLYEVLIITGFSSLPAHRQAVVLQTLLTLRRSPFGYTYIFVSHRPLHEIVTDPYLRTKFLVADHYFLPSSMSEQCPTFFLTII